MGTFVYSQENLFGFTQDFFAKERAKKFLFQAVRQIISDL
jgi:hypothetical protein